MGSLLAFEDIDEESVFMISCTESGMVKRHQLPEGDVEIEGTETLALIYTGTTVNVMDKSMFNKLRTRPIVSHTNAKIYPYGSTKLLDLRGVIAVTARSGAEEIRTTFHVAEGETGKLLGFNASETLRLVSFAKQIRRDTEVTMTWNREQLQNTKIVHSQSGDEMATMSHRREATL